MNEASPVASAAAAREGGGHRLRHWKKCASVALIGLAGIACVAIGAVWGLIDTFGPASLGQDLELSKTVLDRNGRLLRSYTTSEGRWRLPATRDDVDPRFLEVLLAYEDQRFWLHSGVDPLAIGRAALQLVTHGHIVSGGSTITMQVARLIEPRAHRSVYVKLREAVRAIQLERTLSKNEILGLYLTLAPYGGNLEGIRAASLAYFGKEPRRLTLGEAALLVALPQSPEVRRPDRAHGAARAARDRVLDRVAGHGLFSAAEIARAKKELVPHARKRMPMIAPHAAGDAMAIAPNRREQRLTIDAGLQQKLEELARDRARSLGPDMSVAIMVVDNASGEVLARIASPDYFDQRRAGQVDLTRAVRSPGSALKPFIYGLGFEDGLIHPETLIEDRPVRYGGYAPENFDLTFQGTVTIRRALQQSLNVPAVAVLEEVGPNRLATRLGQAGASLVLPRREAPGLALGLGGVGIRLADLTMLYAGLARQGSVQPLVEQLDAPRPGAKCLLEPVAAWYVAKILQGSPPPESAAGGRIAFKTGTSYGYRDAWAVGFDGARTIGVWVGRPDGAPVTGLAGRTAAAPILFD
ncbi:MAG: penicillin-binding protein 1C, partial [Hyphomicrobiales bacterium]